MDKRQIEQILPSLSQKELKEIKNKIDYLLSDLSIVSNESKKELKDLDLFYRCITDELNKLLGRKKGIPLLVLKKSNDRLYKQVVIVYKFLIGYLQELIDKPTKDHRLKFFMLYAELMGDYMKDITFDMIGLSGMLKVHKKFPGMIDDTFPGYLEAGAFSVIFKEFKKG